MLLEKLYCKSGKMMKLENVLSLKYECLLQLYDSIANVPANIKHELFAAHEVSFRNRIGKVVPKAL